MRNIIFLFIFFSLSVNAQNCKYKTDKIDEFTHVKMLETQNKYFTIGPELRTAISCRKLDNTRSLALIIQSNNIFTLKKGDSVSFKTSTGEIFQINFGESVVGQSNSGSEWFGIQNLVLSDEIYNKLKSNIIARVRIETSKGFVDDDVKSNDWMKIINDLKCIE